MSTALLDDSAATSSIDMTYWEALRSYWRICWPALLLGLVAYFPFILIAVRGRIFTLHLTPLGHVLALVVLGALGFLMYLGRILSPFPRFSIQIVASPQGSTALTMRRRTQLWLFVASRQIVGLIVALLMLAPTNVLLSLIGLRAILGVGLSSILTALSLVFVVGPIVIKMLIGHDFSDFRLEVKRY